MDENPVKKVTRPSEADGRVRYLSDHERERLFAECRKSRQKALYPIVLMAINTGMRQGEILNLFWEEPPSPPETGAWGVVELDRQRIVLHEPLDKRHA